MGNTVGSFKINNYWQSKWKLAKPTMTINKKQHSLLIGSMLGDGTLRVGSGAINANLKIEQGLVQKDYVLWKYQGSLNSNKIDISTYSFTENEVQLLQRVFEENFGLVANYYRDRDKGYRMYFKIGETKKLASLIKPYIVDCLKYKINLKTP